MEQEDKRTVAYRYDLYVGNENLPQALDLDVVSMSLSHGHGWKSHGCSHVQGGKRQKRIIFLCCVMEDGTHYTI